MDSVKQQLFFLDKGRFVFLVELQICFLEKPKNAIKQYKLFNKASKLTPTFSRQNRAEVFHTQ